MDPLGVAHADPRGEIGAVGGAVDDRLVDARVVEYRGDVVDDLVDRQRLRREVGAAIVVPRQADAPMLDHDHVQALGCRATAKAPVQRHGRRARPAGDDDQRMRGLAPGPHVVEIELVVGAVRTASHRPPDGANTGKRCELVVRAPTSGVHGH